ncbi:MAG TPA: hypothetical protein VNJ29_00070 [Candidatus Nitrosotenuis sp.]|nr:hypothetical protein [Candidatus Nitrosotenuis sp.]
MSHYSNSPHFILHFDVNKTIVCFDQIQDMSVDQTLTLLFADRIAASWRADLDPMTYKKYVRKFIVPGNELDQTVKKQRLKSYQNLWQELKCLDQTKFEHYQEEWKKARELLTSHHVFPSFFRLIHFLDDHQLSYSIILRTFGNDLDFVIEEIRKDCPQISFVRGLFLKGNLHICDDVLTNMEHIQDFFINHHLAIRDDHHHWHHHHKEQITGGKPFPFRKSDQVVTLFFDDNLKSKQIVQVIDLNNDASDPVSPGELIEAGFLIPVDTLSAISDEDYFVRCIERLLLR